jgi:hypothetical protein
MTDDTTFRDEGVAALRKTTISFPAWEKNVKAGKYNPKDGSATEWGIALNAFAQIGAPPPPPPTGSAGVGTMRWGGSYDPAQVADYAKFDVLGVDVNAPSAPADLAAAGAKTQVWLYRDAPGVRNDSGSNSEQGDSVPIEVARANGWLAHDASGHEITDGVNTMLDFSIPAVSAGIADSFVTVWKPKGFHGCWFDDIVFWATTLYVNLPLPAGWTQETWVTNIVSHVRRISKLLRDAGVPSVYNANGRNPNDSTGAVNGDDEIAFWKLLAAPASGDEAPPTGLSSEYWEQSPVDNSVYTINPSAWTGHWDGWRRVHPLCHQLGIEFWPTMYFNADDATAIYARASFLLDWNGTGIMVGALPGAARPSYGPKWCLNPGAPDGPAVESPAGVWTRRFGSGAHTVVVNANAGTASIS